MTTLDLRPDNHRGPSPDGAEAPGGRSHSQRELTRRTGHFLARLGRTRRRTHRARTEVVDRGQALVDARARHLRAGTARSEAEARLSGDLRSSGHPHDLGRRGLSRPAYLATVAVAGLLAYQLDRGALLVLLLPRATTESIARFGVVLALLGAHWGGHVLRRRHHVVEDRTVLGPHEVLLGNVCVAGGYGLAAVVAMIRAAGSGVLTGFLFLVLGVLDFTVCLLASYFSAHDGVSAVQRARREERRCARSTARRRRALLRSVHRWGGAWERHVARAGAIVQQAEQILAAGPVPARPEPVWLEEARRVAGGTMPAALDARPAMRAAGLPPEEVT